MPWDRVYLNRWFAFMRLLSARYGGSAAFRMIAAAGPTSVSVEMTLPNSPPAHRRWLADGYTPTRYLGAWDDVFRFYAAAFPNQCISIAAPGLPILGPGPKDRATRVDAKEQMIGQAMRVLGNRLAIQDSDLHAGHAEVEAPDNTEFIKSYSGRIIVGFEMRSGFPGRGRQPRHGRRRQSAAGIATINRQGNGAQPCGTARQLSRDLRGRRSSGRDAASAELRGIAFPAVSGRFAAKRSDTVRMV